MLDGVIIKVYKFFKRENKKVNYYRKIGQRY